MCFAQLNTSKKINNFSSFLWFCWWYFVTIIFLSSAPHVIWLVHFFGWFKSIVYPKKYLGSFKRIWPEMLLATIFLTRNGRKMRFQLCVPTTNRSCLPHIHQGEIATDCPFWSFQFFFNLPINIPSHNVFSLYRVVKYKMVFDSNALQCFKVWGFRILVT